jgi:hypothetical protein
MHYHLFGVLTKFSNVEINIDNLLGKLLGFY